MRKTSRLWKTTLLLVVIALLSGSRRPSAGNPGLDEEQQVGQEVFNELRMKGEIVASSPLYDLLNPITAAVIRTAQPRYNIRSSSISCTSSSRTRLRRQVETSTSPTR